MRGLYAQTLKIPGSGITVPYESLSQLRYRSPHRGWDVLSVSDDNTPPDCSSSFSISRFLLGLRDSFRPSYPSPPDCGSLFPKKPPFALPTPWTLTRTTVR